MTMEGDKGGTKTFVRPCGEWTHWGAKAWMYAVKLTSIGNCLEPS